MPTRSLWMTMLFAAAGGGACGETPHPLEQHPMRLLVTNTPGDPLEGVKARLGAQLLGVTGADGYVSLSIAGIDGQRVAINIDCPPNHRGPQEPIQVALFRYTSGTIPEVTAQCDQERVVDAVVVRTHGATGVPILVRGEQIGATDGSGVAHILIKGDPGETVDLVFDTSKFPDLRPISPSARLALGRHDDASFAEQRFEVKKAPPPKAHVVRRPAPSPDLPIRIR